MTVQAKRVIDGEFETIRKVKKICRIDTSKAGSSKREGWVVFEDTGMSFIYDDLMLIISVSED